MNLTDCVAGRNLTVYLISEKVHGLDYSSEAAVAVGSIDRTCDHVSPFPWPYVVNCTLPYVPSAGDSFLPVFIFNRSSGDALTDVGGVGLQYALPVSVSSSTVAPPPWSASSSTGVSGGSSGSGTGGGVVQQSAVLLSGCGWMSVTGVVFGCNGDLQWSASRVTIRLADVNLLPPDWQLTVFSGSRPYVVSGDVACYVWMNSTVFCSLPIMSDSRARGQVLDMWLQDSQQRRLTTGSMQVVYSKPPTITSVGGCCSTEFRSNMSFGCNLPYSTLTVHGSGFARAFDGGAPTVSPIVIRSGGVVYECAVSYYDEWTLQCANLQPAMPDKSVLTSQLSVYVSQGMYYSNEWGVQLISGSGVCSSTGGQMSPPRVTSVWSPNCRMFSTDTTSGCTTNSPTLFTITGSGFLTPSDNGVPVQLWATQSSNTMYSCGTSEMTDTQIVCTALQPSLTPQDNGALLQLTIVTRSGTSNVWWVGVVDDGQYVQPSSSSSASIAGMSFVTFIVVVSIVAVVAVLILSLAVLSCCCGVGVSAVLGCCCRSRATSSSSASCTFIPMASVPLVVPPPPLVAESPSPFSSSASRFGQSLPPNPQNYPAVSRDGYY